MPTSILIVLFTSGAGCATLRRARGGFASGGFASARAAARRDDEAADAAIALDDEVLLLDEVAGGVAARHGHADEVAEADV